MAIDGGEVKIRFEGDIDPLRRSVEEAIGDIEDLKNASEDLDKNISGFGNTAKQEFDKFADSATDAFTRAIDSSDTFIENIKSIGTALKAIGFGALTAGATVATKSLIKMAKGAISDTSALENVQIQMIGLTDSVEKGNKAMAMAVQYFKHNPFNRFDVTSATKNLIQFGAELDDIPVLLDKLGKVSLSTGAGLATMAYYYQRTIADGRIATRDLLQMQNQGVPIFGALAKQMGVTAGAVRELAAEGKIAIEDFQKAFDNLVSDEAMERFNNTLSRQIDRFKGRISNLRASLAGYSTSVEGGLEIDENGLYRSVTKMLRTFSDIMDSEVGQRLYAGFEKLGKALSEVINGFTKLIEPALKLAEKFLNFIGDNSELLIPLLGGLAVALGKLGSNLPVVGELIRGVTSHFTQLKSGIIGIISTHPLLSAFIGLLTVGFAEAIKTDEEFRTTISELLGALKDLASNLMIAVRGVLKAFVDLIKQIASSDAVKGVLKAIAGALKGIAQALASIPPEALASLISFFVSLKLLNANPIIFAVTAIGLLIQYIKELGGVDKILENLPETLNTIGHNMMTGLFNGIKEGATKVINFVKQVASSIVDGFRNVLGIHSPSTVMYEIGQNIVLGLANGVEDTSDAVQIAMNNLAGDILKLGEKVISNKLSFGVIDVQGEYEEWKKFSQLFTEGSEQYAYALEKMEDARKTANLQILNLQKTYNDALDTTISKISSMYGIFDEVSLKSSSNSSKIIKNLDQQVSKLQEWSSAQEAIRQLDLAPEFIEELEAMGVGSTSELSAIANMTADELSTLNDLWLQKQSIANKAGVEQMKGLKEDTLKQIDALKSGIDGATVDISDVGGRLVESISEGVYGAMPTLESALAKLDEYIEKAKKGLAGSTDTKQSGDEDENDDLISGIKKEIEGSIENLKSMLPNIILGAIGAWGALKFGPKILKAIFNKVGGALLNSGSSVAQGIAGSLFKSADLGEGLRSGLLRAIDGIPREEHTVSGKLLDKVQGWLTPKETGEVAEAVKNVSNTAKPAKTIAKSTSEVSESLTSTGQSMSKASGILNTVKEGAQTIIWIAGAIAAMAGALWLTSKAFQNIDYKALNSGLVEMGVAVVEFGGLALLGQNLGVDARGILIIIGVAADIALVALACRAAYELMGNIDFGKFQLVLVEMAEAVLAMGALATAAGVVLELTAGAMALGILAIIGLAADIVVIAGSIKIAWENMKDIDFIRYQAVLGMMIETLAAFGGFSAIIGIFSGLVALGWVAVIAVCDELVKTSDALLHVYNTVPDDIEKVKTKVTLIKETLRYVSETDLGHFIGALATGISVGPLTATMEMYDKVAGILARMSELTIDDEKVGQNIDSVKLALEKVRSKTNIISGFLQGWADEGAAKSVEASGRILITYGEVVDAINKMSNLEVNESTYKSIDTIAGVVKYVKDTSGKMFGWFNNVGSFSNDIEHIQNIIEKFVKIIPTAQEISKKENNVTSVKQNALDNIKAIEEIVYQLGESGTAGYIEAKEKDLGAIQSIINKFTEIAPVAYDVSQSGITKWKGNAIKEIKAIEDIVLEIGRVDTAGWIDQKESDMGKIQSILNKFTEVAKTTHHFGKEGYDIAEGALTYVQNVRNLVWEIGQINTKGSKDIGTKEKLVNSATTMAGKFKELQTALKELDTTDYTTVVNNMVTTINNLLTGVSNNISGQFENFKNLGAKLSEQLSAGMTSVSFEDVGAQVQGQFWWAIQNRMNDEYYQGRSMGETFRQGLYDIDYANAGWWAVQGFVNGANNRGHYAGGDSVYWVGYRIANEFLKGLKDRGEQGSPWKTTMESGQWAVEGLIEGLESQESALVGEAYSLADQVVDALTLNDISMTPELDANVSGRLAPSMFDNNYGIVENGRGVVINQEIQAYTPVDMDAISRNLAWDLANV